MSWARPAPSVTLFNLQRRALRHPSQCSYMTDCENSPPVALFPSMVVLKLCGTRENRGEGADGTHIIESFVDQRNTVMIEKLKELFGKISREPPAKTPKSVAKPTGRSSAGDFRAVEIARSIMCCSAAVQVTGRSYLLREAPRLPLMGCTMPTNCSCKFRKSADRRDSDRRLYGATETNRWFVGVECRKREARRSAEK
jgi:hypothetical protein